MDSVILPQLRLLRLEHCDIGALETSETSTLCTEAGQMSVLATEDICPVPAADICPVITEDIYFVSAKDIAADGRRLAAVLSPVETG